MNTSNSRCIILLILNYLPFFFFNDTATTEIYTLSLHDALPSCWWSAAADTAHSPGCCSARSASTASTTPPARSWSSAATSTIGTLQPDRTSRDRDRRRDGRRSGRAYTGSGQGARL